MKMGANGRIRYVIHINRVREMYAVENGVDGNETGAGLGFTSKVIVILFSN